MINEGMGAPENLKTENGGTGNDMIHHAYVVKSYQDMKKEKDISTRNGWRHAPWMTTTVASCR